MSGYPCFVSVNYFSVFFIFDYLYRNIKTTGRYKIANLIKRKFDDFPAGGCQVFAFFIYRDRDMKKCDSCKIREADAGYIYKIRKNLCWTCFSLVRISDRIEELDRRR